MAKLVRRKCPCLRPKIEEEVRVLDYRHSSLTDVPSDVFNFERTLEELYADSNQIRDLPRELFYCHGIRKLSLSDNEITNIPPAIASLDHLEELDFSKNGIIDVPDNIKCCKYLRIIDASVNPLGKLPEGFTQLQNLTHLFLNDTFLDYLPGSFGRLVKLKILEIRENHLKTLPKSFGRLTELERLDIGNNEFTELPDVVGCLTKLLELWCDNNQIVSLTHTIGALKQLIFLDASKNELQSLPGEIEGCSSLADLHLTTNQLHSLPDALGNLSNLTTLKVDDNQLTSLPTTVGGLTSLSELNASVNDLEELPPSIGLLRNLRTFYADENILTFVPAELGSCSGITVLSLRSNKLTYIPDEIGRIPRLRVLNLSDNHLNYLPFTIVKLKELQALWLTENQTRPLIPLQSDYEAETGRKILTCYLLPQGHNSDNEETGGDGDTDSFHASIWDEERQQRQQIHFSFGDEDEDEGHLVRCPTPYPKEMREKARHMRNMALRQSATEGGQSPQSQHTGRNAQGEDKDSYLGAEDVDVRMGEGRTSKPQSPSLQETHRLFSHDKEKLMRDKARMQNRHSMPDMEDKMAAFASKRGDSTSGASDTDDVRVTGRRKSTPNLFSFEDETSEGNEPKRMPSFTYEDLYRNQILQKHHHRHGRRSRRTRDYESDTGGRGERDTRGDVRDDMSVRSQPVMSRSKRHGHKKDNGYASDVEAYAGRGRGLSRGGVKNKPAPSPTSQQPLNPSRSVPQDLDHQASGNISHDHPTVNFRPQSCLTVPNARPDFNAYQRSASTPSPSRLQGDIMRDSHSPFSSQPQQYTTSGNSVQPQTGADSKDRSVQRDLYTVLEERKRNATAQDVRPSPTPSAARSQSLKQTPPPYQPAPPYRRPSDRMSDQSDTCSIRSASQSSVKGNNSFSLPDYSSGTKRSNSDSVAPEDRDYETLAVLTNRMDIQRPSSVGHDQRTSRDQILGAGGTAQYGKGMGLGNDGSDGNQVSQSQTNRVMGSQVYRQGEGLAAQYGQGSGVGYEGSVSSQASNGDRVLTQPPHGLLPQNQALHSDKVLTQTPHSNRVLNQDYSLSSYTAAGRGAGSTPLYPPPPPARPLSQPSHYANRSRDNLTPVSAHSSHSDPRHSPHPVFPSTSLGDSKHSHHPLLPSSSLMDSRHSPHPILPSSSRPRLGSREVADPPTTSPKAFEAYPNPYGEPLEVRDPLMNRYEDVAIFKSMQDQSQVSSSTDSGYGHGPQLFERFGDFSARRSGSPYSSTPSHRDTPVRQNSSSQGTPSRETTPVREESFFSLQGPDFSTQESRDVFRAVVHKNPGLGFSITGGQGSLTPNPFKAGDSGIFVSKVQPGGPAASFIQPGDKLLKVNRVDFTNIDHNSAVSVLKTSSTVELLVERIQKINLV